MWLAGHDREVQNVHRAIESSADVEAVPEVETARDVLEVGTERDVEVAIKSIEDDLVTAIMRIKMLRGLTLMADKINFHLIQSVSTSINIFYTIFQTFILFTFVSNKSIFQYWSRKPRLFFTLNFSNYLLI